MKKLFSLIKAAMSQDMNLFKVKQQKKSGLGKIIFPVILASFFMICIGVYAYGFAEILNPMGLIDVLLSIFIILTAVLTILEGAYKSQGMLFEAKDSELLFSLPITKKMIFTIRIIKLMTFQFLYNSLFLIPSVIVYGIYKKVDLNFCMSSILMIVLSPIIPTIIGCIIGYIIKGISSKFKSKRFVQVILSSSLLLVVLYISFNKNKILEYITQNASNIDVLIKQIYYPAVLFSNLIKSFNITEFLILLAICILPLVIFIYFGSIYYFTIISKSGEKGISKKTVIKNNKYKVKKPQYALIAKELKRFFTSPVFIINSGFGLVLIVVATIGLVTNFKGLVAGFSSGIEAEISTETVMQYISKIYLCLVVLMSFMTSITSSMISLEGKNIEITKSLPVSSKKILLAKILTSNIISIPVILICPSLSTQRELLLSSTCPENSSGCLRMYWAAAVCFMPREDANSDTEIVKQSMSAFIATISGMILGLITAGIIFIDGEKNIIIIIELIFYCLLDILLWQYVAKKGSKKFEKLSV